MNKDFDSYQLTTKQTVWLMVVAYLFSLAIRYIWVYKMSGHPEFYWNGQLMINTNDGYFFASGVQKALYNMHLYNPRVPDIFSYGVVFFTYLITKITPFSLETVMLYMPAFVSSLVVVPIILIARLYKQTLWGFFAALLGSIAWSYYNRTMTGYYDTDMFSAMAPMFIVYFLMKSTMENSLKSAFYASIMITLYPFLYDQGLSIVYAIGIIYAIYMIFYHRDESNTYKSLFLVFTSLLSLKSFGLVVPYNYILKLFLIIGLYRYFQNRQIDRKKMIIATALMFVMFIYLGNVFGLIYHKVFSYIVNGTEDGKLHFFAVNQTVREAGKIPFEVFANRISGSIPGLIVSILGYALLVWRYRAFILALPLVGIGAFALFGGLRFTVYAVPVAAISAIFLFHFILNKITDKKPLYIAGLFVLSMILIYPNITHVLKYLVPTVFTSSEVKVLDTLHAKSNQKDYTIAWWDYGYPIWYYSNTNTLIDGGKHDHDNFIVSEILTTTSQIEAANLARVAVETYISSGYKTVADRLFSDENPQEVLERMKESSFRVPSKTRDIFLYLPMRMLNILPTVTLFSNIDLISGKRKKEPLFYKTQNFKKVGTTIFLGHNVTFDLKDASLHFGKKKVFINSFIITTYDKAGKLHVQKQLADFSSSFYVIYMQSYNTFLILDQKMFNSTYIQLYVLENYDPKLFEPIVLSPIAKIFKVRR